MKKKLIALVLALSACFSMTACDVVKDKLSGLPIIGGLINKDSSTEDPAEEYDLDGAKKLLESRVKTKNAESREEYAVPASFQLLGVTYTVEWSVDVDTVKIEKDGDEVYVNVYEASLLFEDTPFVLTAKIFAPDGTSIETRMNRIVPKLERYAPAAIMEKPQEDVAYKLNAYSVGKSQELYFAGETAKYSYYLKTTDSYDNGVDVYAEHVEGSEDEFYLYHILKDTGAKQYINIVQSGTHINAQLSSEPVALKFSTKYGTFYRNLDGIDCVLATEGDYGTFGGAKAGDIGEDISAVCLVEEVDRLNVDDEDKLKYELTTLNLAPAYLAGGESATIVTHGSRYPDVKISWKADSNAVSLKRTVLSFNDTETSASVTLTATLTIGDKTKTKALSFTVVPNKTEDILAAAAAFNSGEAFGNSVELTGVVVSIDEAYDATHDNVTFTMKVGDTRVQGYHMKGDGADVLAPGFTVTCSGEFMNFKGTLEFSSGRIESYEVGEAPETPEAPETAEEILNALYALANNETMTGEFTLTGKITALDNYNNPTIVVEGFDSMPVYCYRLSVENKIGDVITVTAKTMKNYGGTYEFMDCTLVTSGNEGGNEGETTTTITAPKADTPYLMYLEQLTLNKTLYLTGKPNGDYLETSANVANAAYVYAEAVTGGYKFYVLDENNAKSYIYLEEYQKEGKNYYSASIEWAADGSVFSYNSNGCWATTLANDTYFIGTNQSWETVSAASSHYFSEIGSTNFPLLFIEPSDVTPPAGGEGGEVTPPADDTDAITTPEAGKAYTMSLYQGTLGKTLYLAGGLDESGKYLAATENASEAANVYAEAANGGYKFYVLDENNNKTYIHLEQYQKENGYYGARTSWQEDGTIFTYNAAGCWATTLANDTFFLGTYDKYNTVSASASHYMTAANMGTTQFPLLLNELSDVTPPAGGEGGEGEGEGETPVPPTGGDEGDTTLTQADIVEQAYALTGSATLNATLTGVISKVDTAYSSEHSNVTVTIIVEDLTTKPIMCYRMKGTGADTIGVGDVITVTGTIKNYYGTIEFDTGCTFVLAEDTTVLAETKLFIEANEINLPTSVSEAGNITVPTIGELYQDVTIAWNTNSNFVVVAGDNLTVTMPNETTVVTLTATLSCNGIEKVAEFTLTLSVVSESASWKMVTDLSQLKAGAKIVIAALASDVNYAIGDNQKTSNRGASAITKTGDSISFDDANIEVLTLVAGTKDGTFAFQTEEGTYLYAASSSSNHLKSSTSLDDNGSWAITIAADGTATVVSQGSNARNTMQYNPNNGSPLFSCYAPDKPQQPICIYIYA